MVTIYTKSSTRQTHVSVTKTAYYVDLLSFRLSLASHDAFAYQKLLPHPIN